MQVPEKKENQKPSFALKSLLVAGRWAARWPWPYQYVAGLVLMPWLLLLLPSRRKAAARNLALCFPALSTAARTRLLLEHFSALGIGIFEFLRAWWGEVDDFAPRTQIKGLERLDHAKSQGRGVLLVSGHFTTFEVGGRLLIQHRELAAMYRVMRPPALEAAVRAGRQRYLTELIARDNLRGAIRHLRASGILWYAPDQDMLGKNGVFAPFFDVPAWTVTATAELARLGRADVMPFFIRRQRGRYFIEIGPPLENFPSGDPVADATTINAMLEQLVLNAPSQYLWIHRRFKRQPPGTPSRYD